MLSAVPDNAQCQIGQLKYAHCLEKPYILFIVQCWANLAWMFIYEQLLPKNILKINFESEKASD